VNPHLTARALEIFLLKITQLVMTLTAGLGVLLKEQCTIFGCFALSVSLHHLKKHLQKISFFANFR